MRKISLYVLLLVLAGCKGPLKHTDRSNDLYSDSSIKPILLGNWADPTILKHGDDYYMVTNSGPFIPSNLIWHTRDLINWTPLTYASQNHVMGLAPDITFYNGKYFIYGGNIDCYYADDPLGPWNGPYYILPAGTGIDPCAVSDEEGNRHMYISEGQYFRLSEDGLNAASPVRKIYNGWDMPENWANEGKWLESPKVFQHNGWYYMLSAEGGTKGPSTSHMIVSARSKNPDGPWENDPENPILYTRDRDEEWWSKGHGTAFLGPDDQWYMIFHGYKNGFRSIGRCVLLQPCEWTEEGWLQLSRTVPSWWDQSVVINLDNSDEFESNELGLQWQFYLDHEPARYSFKNGSLILDGRGEDIASSFPMLVQAMDIAYEVETEITLTGDVTAGMVLFYNDIGYIGIGLGPDGILKKYLKSPAPFYNPPDVQLPARSLRLKIINDRQDVRMYYAVEDDDWRILQPGADVSYFTANAFGEFNSLRPGIFVYGEGKALFENFSYKPL